MSDSPPVQIYLPAMLATYLEKHRIGGPFRRIWDNTFGAAWLIESTQGADLTRHGWSEGDEWFHDTPPNLYNGATCFPSQNEPLCTVFIECWDYDQRKNDERILDFKKRCLQAETDDPLEIQARYIAEQWGRATPHGGWTPAFLPRDKLKLEASPEQRETYLKLRLHFETFRQAAESLASKCKGVDEDLHLEELYLPWAKGIIAIGAHGNGYTSFYVGEKPHLDQLD